eukprot:5428304-Pyramimonas_sp.AAC.1
MTTKWKAEQHGYSTVFTNYDCPNAFASAHKSLLQAVAFKRADEWDKPRAANAIGYTTLTMDTAEGETTMATTTGSQMGFTTAPRQFNGGYTIYVEKWNTQERQGPRQRLHDTPRPITGKVCDLALNTFMDDITTTHTMLPAA